MKVAVVGSGGREHALAYKIKESPLLENLYIIPGNPGTLELGENLDIKADDYQKILEFSKTENIDLVVIGPEQPLIDGLADLLRSNGIKVFGPDKKAAVIEGEKSFAKELMKKYSIPTAGYEIFEKKDYDKAVSYLNHSSYPVVIKADGLAAGKGVAICDTIEEAEKTLREYFVESKFGSAGEKVVIEEFLEGEEASIFVITDGSEYLILPPSQDHKKIYDGDKGKNTGGMGAYAPAPVVDELIIREVDEKIIIPAIEGMNREGRSYAGCLYIGIIITESGPAVIEFNCRFGDPETQVVLPLLEGDFLKLLESSAEGRLNKDAVRYNGGSALCVIAASKGYPEKYEKGFQISGLKEIDEKKALVFHAGTKIDEGRLVTNGGRVLGITSYLKYNNIKDCKQIAYTYLSKVKYSNMYYRTDIGYRAVDN